MSNWPNVETQQYQGKHRNYVAIYSNITILQYQGKVHRGKHRNYVAHTAAHSQTQDNYERVKLNDKFFQLPVSRLWLGQRKQVQLGGK